MKNLKHRINFLLLTLKDIRKYRTQRTIRQCNQKHSIQCILSGSALFSAFEVFQWQSNLHDYNHNQFLSKLSIGFDIPQTINVYSFKTSWILLQISNHLRSGNSQFQAYLVNVLIFSFSLFRLSFFLQHIYVFLKISSMYGEINDVHNIF